MYKNFSKVIIFLIFVALITPSIYAQKYDTISVPNESEIKSMAFEGDSFKKKESPFLYYEIYKKNKLIGYLFNTKDVVPEEKGYNAPIEMLVALGKEGTIKSIQILTHSETNEYASDIIKPSFLDQFKGKNSEDKLIVGEDIDAITHATISSKAVASTLKTSLIKIKEVTQGFKEKRKRDLDLNLDFYLTLFIITFLLVVFYLRINWLRYIGLACSILYFGFMKANFISMTNIGKIFLWNLPDFNSNIAWYLFIFSGIILTFLLGSFYCSFMCPFGGVQVFLNKLFKFNIKITPRLTQRLRKIKYILLWIFIILILLLKDSNIVNYEPFSTLFLRRGSIVSWSILSIILALSLFHHRVFCNYFCATGALLDILSKFGRKVLKKK